MYDGKDGLFYDENDSIIDRQLKFFLKKDLEKKYSNEKLYVKAYYLHHLLDYLRETRVNIYDIELVFKEFLNNKVNVEFSDINGNVFNFKKEIEDIFQLIRENKQEIYNDLKGENVFSLEKKGKKSEKNKAKNIKS